MENVNGRSSSSETLHCGTAPGGNCAEFNGMTSGLATCSGCQTSYHTYSEIIDRTTSDEQVRFYQDNQQVWVVNESQVGIATWQTAMDHGFFLSLDLAIGGAYPNTVCGCTSPSAQTSSGGTLSVGSLGVFTSTGPVPPPLTAPPVPNGPSVVKVTGGQGNWGLSVNGASYQIKGRHVRPASATAEAHMTDLKSLGRQHGPHLGHRRHIAAAAGPGRRQRNQGDQRILARPGQRTISTTPTTRLSPSSRR